MADDEALSPALRATCRALVVKYQAHAAHAECVSRLCERLLSTTRYFSGIQREDWSPVLAAAYLLNIGALIDPEYHHRHGRYLVMHDALTDAWPASLRRDVGLLVLNHRKRNPRGLEALRRPDLKRILRLAAIVRLADVLDRAHHQTAVLEAVSPGSRHEPLTIHLSGVELAGLEPHLTRKAAWGARVWRRDLELVCGADRIRIPQGG
ncbi:MAG: hypothetical protein VKP62_13605 [Candidatus Sericytochromatia bacterium]|nr:hypothetical protein [Candidatus Sericytochromatia bacterium]